MSEHKPEHMENKEQSYTAALRTLTSKHSFISIPQILCGYSGVYYTAVFGETLNRVLKYQVVLTVEPVRSWKLFYNRGVHNYSDHD